MTYYAGPVNFMCKHLKVGVIDHGVVAAIDYSTVDILHYGEIRRDLIV